MSHSRPSLALVVIAFAAVAAGAIATRGFGAFGGGESPSGDGTETSAGHEQLAAADAESQLRLDAAEAAVRQLLDEPIRSTRIKPIPEPAAHEIKPHAAPLDDRLLTPGNFEYRGAFTFPLLSRDDHKSIFAYGGHTLAFRPDGDTDGEEDGYPGSLFTVGHDHDQLVAEVSIPKPRYLVDRRGEDLPKAKLLQSFGDVSDGFIKDASEGTEPFKIGGLFVTNDRLHWTLYKYYNVDHKLYDSHATSSLDLTKPKPEGLWHLGAMHSGAPAWHSYKYAGYIFDVPPGRAKDDLKGLNLVSGLQISTGRQVSSQGPAMYVYQLPPAGTPRGASLVAVPLLYYPMTVRELPGHNPADHWRGGAWIKIGSKEGVIIAGRKSLGPLYYGEARPTDCTPDKGYHGTPYEPQVLFYDADQLMEVARGRRNPWSVDPYLRWTSQSPGGGLKQYFFDTCHGRLSGVAYDRANQLLYMVQYEAARIDTVDLGRYPVVHVFKIKDV